MRALIRKDITILWKSLLLNFILYVAISVISLVKGIALMLPMAAIMLQITIISMSFTNDFQSNFQQMAFSMPIKRKDYVLSKMFYPFIYALLAGIFTGVFCIIYEAKNIEVIIISALSIFVLVLLLSAIQLPFIIKYGGQKAQLIIVANYLIIYAIIFVLKDIKGLGSGITNLITSIGVLGMGIAFIIISLLITYLCVHISIKIINKMEY